MRLSMKMKLMNFYNLIGKMVLNYTWRNACCINQEYENVIDEFLQFFWQNGRPIKGTC